MTGTATTTLYPLITLLGSAEWTREIFGNVPPWAKACFYVLAAAAIATFAHGCYRRVKLWRRGRKTSRPEQVPARRDSGKYVSTLNRLLRDVLLQRRMRGTRPLASTAHKLLFTGFVVLFIGTILIAIEHVAASLAGRAHDNPLFHKGLYYAAYEVTLDLFGVAFLVGCALLIYRRLRRPPSLDHNAADWCVLGGLFLIGITGFFVEGLRIILAPNPGDQFSLVGNSLARVMSAAGVGATSATAWHFALWWVHAILALGLIAAFPYTRLLHSFAGAVNLAQPPHALGQLSLVSIEEVEETGMVGVGRLEDFTWRQFVELDACVSCGRCEDVCPAHEGGRPLSPRNVVQDVRGLLAFASHDVGDAKNDQRPSLHGDTISAETLWSCTTCSACVDVCPLGINPLGMITDMRQYLVAEGKLSGSPAMSLQKTQRSGNPWGLPATDRFAWADGLNVPTVADHPDFDLLYWVGCAASYDRRVQKVARSVVRLLQAAEVNFAVLGNEERCTAESARRMGDEFLFQEVASGNVATLQQYNVKKIITHCPHCLNSLSQDYAQLGGHFEVIHHTTFLSQLVADGRLPLQAAGPPTANGSLTYHDPCYLARVHNVTQAPREVLATAAGASAIKEMPRNGRQTACCGAGGGRMWFDDAADERIGRERVNEALATRTETIAVGCPFCLIMVGDGVKAQNSKTEVRDIAEILADRLAVDNDQ